MNHYNFFFYFYTFLIESLLLRIYDQFIKLFYRLFIVNLLSFLGSSLIENKIITSI
jgi:hypothetical protein